MTGSCNCSDPFSRFLNMKYDVGAGIIFALITTAIFNIGYQLFVADYIESLKNGA